jgi:RimJ/RimL family protein N-acetyltransferase
MAVVHALLLSHRAFDDIVDANEALSGAMSCFSLRRLMTFIPDGDERLARILAACGFEFEGKARRFYPDRDGLMFSRIGKGV